MSTPQQRTRDQDAARLNAMTDRKEVPVPHERNMRFTPSGRVRVHKTKRKGAKESASWTTDTVSSARRWLEQANEIHARGGTVSSGSLENSLEPGPAWSGSRAGTMDPGLATPASAAGRTLNELLDEYQAKRYLDHVDGRTDLTAMAGGTLSDQQMRSDDRVAEFLRDEVHGLATKPARTIEIRDVRALQRAMRSDNKSVRDQDLAVSLLNSVLKAEARGFERPQDWPFPSDPKRPAQDGRRRLPRGSEGGLTFAGIKRLMAFMPVQVQAVVVLAFIMALRFSEILGLYLGDLVLPAKWRTWAGAVRSAAAQGTPVPDEVIDTLRQSAHAGHWDSWAHLKVQRQRVVQTAINPKGKAARVTNTTGKSVIVSAECVTGRLKSEASVATLPVPPSMAVWLWWYIARFHPDYDPFDPTDPLAHRLLVVDPLKCGPDAGMPSHKHTTPPAPDGTFRHAKRTYVRSKFNAGRKLLGIATDIPPLKDWNSPHQPRRLIGWLLDHPPADVVHKTSNTHKELWIRHAGPPRYSVSSDDELNARLMECAAYIEELTVARVGTMFVGPEGPRRGAWTDTPEVDCGSAGTHLTLEQVKARLGLNAGAVHALARKKHLTRPTRAWVTGVDSRSPLAVYDRRDIEDLQERRTPPVSAMLLAEAARTLECSVVTIRRLVDGHELKPLEGPWVVPGKGRVHLVTRSSVAVYANRENFVVITELLDGGPATAEELHRRCRSKIPGRVPQTIRRMEDAGTIARLPDGRYDLT